MTAAPQEVTDDARLCVRVLPDGHRPHPAEVIQRDMTSTMMETYRTYCEANDLELVDLTA